MNLSNITSAITTADLSMGERGIESAKVVLTGFVVVFAVLVLLILIIKLYGFIIAKAQNAAENRKKAKLKQSSQSKPADTPKAESVKPAQPQPQVQDGISEEVVAVISAAVATTYGSSQKLRVKSIKKSNSGRSAWANAGVLDNTRPF